MEGNNPGSKAKDEKFKWFHSLTRLKRSETNLSTMNTNNDYSTSSNNNEQENSNTNSLQENVNSDSSSSRKRKDEKNIFQRFRKKMGFHLHSLRRPLYSQEIGIAGDMDASEEFITRSPLRSAMQPLGFSFDHSSELYDNSIGSEQEMVPFTHDYKRFLVKKWLECDTPNPIMYKASLEMLSQVWYWGEIPRRDAQKQLTDKPTGSFLVRDSESKGYQFTLSFRVLNVTLHYRLEYRDNFWLFEELEYRYKSIVDMIEDILARCVSENFMCFVKVANEMQPPLPVILKYPLSRYAKLPLLQDLCRRKIQKHLNVDEISNLPVPLKMREYLQERHELVFQV